jgi:parallel beta-helix repeat protein
MNLRRKVATPLLAALASVLLFGCGGATAPPPAEQLPDTPIFYVDANTGADTNSGRTPQSAFKTLKRAAGAVKPGWTVEVMSGTYTNDGSENPLTISVSGTPDAWITFKAADGHHPVIQIPRGVGAWAGIQLIGVAYVVIDGFEVIGQRASITASEAAQNDGSQPWLNHNCIYVDGVGYADVHPPVPHDIIIRNSTLHDCTAAGIEVNVADAITIEHNRIYDNSWWTVFGTSGIGLYHLTDAPGSTTKNGYKNFIVGNLSWGNRNNVPFKGDVPPGIYDGNGIIVDDAKHTQRALGIHDVQGVPYTGHTYIANNVVHDNGGRGIHLYRSEHVDVVNNTSWNDMLSDSEFVSIGQIDALQCDEVNIVNNVVVNLNSKPVTFDDGNRYDYNLWDGAKVPFKWNQDIAGKALLVDPGSGNFAPGAGSPALGSGTSTLAPPDDFLGNPRPAGKIDRGAIQVSR